MKRLTMRLLTAFVLAASASAFSADAGSASLKEATIITEVLEWGETVTALRLEYTDEIDCRAVEYNSERPGKVIYNIVNDRTISNLYVNNSGRKDDVGLYGKYVFINLNIKNIDNSAFRDQVTFNTARRYRDKVSAFYGSQSGPIVTRAGSVVTPNRFVTTREIALGVDDFATFTYKNEKTGHTLYYHLFIPRGYEALSSSSKLPLVVHYPSGDYSYTDNVGKYRGALFTHPDAVIWSSEVSQASNLAFVVTVGGPVDATWTADFSRSEMQQNYLQVIHKIMADYGVDPSRIYGISLAGGSVPMWNTILANPSLFAAQISTAFDPYHAYTDLKLGEGNFATVLQAMPGWFFSGLTDATGAGSLGPSDSRLRGERLKDVAEIMNKRGMDIDIGYGKEGELMWNGLLRGDKAEQLARAQLTRAKAGNAKHLVTLYIPGTISLDMHFSWNPTYSNSVVRNWLFQQVNDAPYVPEI
jgi:predicted peptidase